MGFKELVINQNIKQQPGHDQRSKHARKDADSERDTKALYRS